MYFFRFGGRRLELPITRQVALTDVGIGMQSTADNCPGILQTHPKV